MLTQEKAERVGEEWLDAWNRHDLKKDNFYCLSPLPSTRLSKPAIFARLAYAVEGIVSG